MSENKTDEICKKCRYDSEDGCSIKWWQRAVPKGCPLSSDEMRHLADFLGEELRRRYKEGHNTGVMQCWDCMDVIHQLEKKYKLHWDKDKQRYKEEGVK